MKYLLNSAVITSPGVYEYRLITPKKARRWYREEPKAVSAIGYQETAIALGELLEDEIQVNRVMISMQPGDEALVFRLVFPPGTPRVNPNDKGEILRHLHEGHWELGLLRRIA